MAMTMMTTRYNTNIMNNTNSILRNYRLGQTMKITPISEPSVAVAVVADEENVIATKNFVGAPGEDVDERSSPSSRWNKCLIAGLITGVLALVAVVAICASLPLIHTREIESGAVQSATLGMNQSGEFTRFINSITVNGEHGTCSIGEQGYSITYTPNEGFFGVDTCTYTVVVCADTDGCDNTEETASFHVEDPDAPTTSPDAMVLVSEERTESTTSTPPTATAAAAHTTKTSPDEEGVAPPFAAKSSAVANPCSECSITNGQNNFCGKLGIYTFLDACESQTECKERGLACMTCSSVEGYDEDVGNGAYICVEDEGGDKASDVTTTTTTTTTTLPTTTSSPRTNSIEASLGGIESLIGTKWQAAKIMWRLDSSVPEELKDATEEDKYPIILNFMSDTRVGGTCGNNSCSIGVNTRADQIMFVGKFRRTRMVASEQEQNYVHLLQGNAFNYQVVENSNGSLELDLKEIETGQLVATYVQLSSEEEDV